MCSSDLGVAEDASDLLHATKLLAHPELMTQLTYPQRQILDHEAFDTREPTQNDYLDLTTSGITLTGPFRQAQEFYIDFPPNRLLAEGSEL